MNGIELPNGYTYHSWCECHIDPISYYTTPCSIKAQIIYLPMMQQRSSDALWLIGVRGQLGALPIIFIYYTIKRTLSTHLGSSANQWAETISVLGLTSESSVGGGGRRGDGGWRELTAAAENSSLIRRARRCRCRPPRLPSTGAGLQAGYRTASGHPRQHRQQTCYAVRSRQMI